mgnify:CR=1 FL=1
MTLYTGARGQDRDSEPSGLLREIDPNAHWHADVGDYGFEEIASIGFGTGYLDALWHVAGSPSDPMSPRLPRSDSVH